MVASIKKFLQQLLFRSRKEQKVLKKLIADLNEADKQKTIAINSMESILNSIDAIIYASIPHTGEILFVNDQMKKAYKKTEGELVGSYCYKVFKGRDSMCNAPGCPCVRLDEEPDKIIVWEDYSVNLGRYIRHSDCYIDWPNGEKVHLQHAVDITELVTAKEQAEQSNRSKSIFLSHMSHEIRTPMNAILGIAEIQLQNHALLPETEDAFSKIYESGDLLLNIINDILDLSRIESGKLELVPIRYSIPNLINDSAQLIHMRYENKPITFKLDVEENTPLELIGDELRIKQLLNNVLSNAFKYTDEGSVELYVSAEAAAEAVAEAAAVAAVEASAGAGQHDDENVNIVFRVKDTGQGMTESQLTRLYDEYSRFNLVTNRTTVGAGLGMSITKRLVDLMNGSINVESEPGKGSTFTIRLIQKRAGPAICGAELADNLKNLRFQSASIIKKTQYIREYMPYGKVLIVDDVESNIYVTKGLLIPYGLEIESVTNGYEAIDKIKGGSVYDIIFMDHMMPKMDGIETVRIIRNIGYTNKIVALTANALVGQAEIFLQNGFDSFISKPIDSRELNHLLNDLIRNRKPPEVVEEARRQKRVKELSNLFDHKLSQREAFFVLDADKALNILGDAAEKLSASCNEVSRANDCAFNDEDKKSFVVTVHGMKSALANIGEIELSETARKLEKAGDAWDIHEITEKLPGFIKALKSLLLKLKPADEDTGMEMSGGETVFLQEKLQSIKTACFAFDKKTAKAALEELRQKTWPRRITAVLDDIAVHILHSEFKKAAVVADNCLQASSFDNIL